MGYADYLLIKEIAYGSDEALKELESILYFISDVAYDESEKLGKELGVPAMCAKLAKPRRNITLMTVAPTGTISILAGCSSGIEPIFSEITIRNDKTGTYTFENNLAEKSYFRCAVSSNGATEVTWEEHVRTLASAQKYVDSGVSKCVEKGTLIPTNKGLIRIEDFSDNTEDDTFSDTRENFFTEEGYKINSHYKAGKKPGTKITLNNGVTIVGASSSHRILTDKGWKIISELKVGDLVLGKKIESHGIGKEPILWDSVYRTSSNKIKVPETMTPDFAKFLGMVTADGYTNHSTGYTGISCKDSDVEKTFIELCYSLFGIYPNITEDKRSGVKSIYLTSRNLSDLVEELIGKGAYNKKVPAQILRGNKEEKLAYLSGLSLDGYVRRDGLTVYYGMSENLVRDVAEICRSFGYSQTYIGSKKVKGFGVAYGVTVGGFLQEQINCVETRKNVTAYEKDYLVYVDRNTIENTRVPLTHPKYQALKSMRLYRKNQTYCFNSTAKAFGWNTDTLVYKVTKTEEVGLKEMYDIEVNTSHSYTISGIISHNTINFPTHTRKETMGKAVILAWREGCKGLAMYRNGSRKVEVLTPKNLKKDLCPICGNEMIEIDGKKKCLNCNKDNVIENTTTYYD